MNLEELYKKCQKFNRVMVKEFRKRNAETIFLQPAKLSFTQKNKPTEHPDDSNCFTKKDEQIYFQSLHYVKYKIALEFKRKSNLINKYAIFYKYIRNKIVSANMKLLYKCISLTSIKLDENTLLGAGQLAIMNAVESFDPWRGFSFSTYAMTCIFRQFIREAKKESLIKTRQDEDPSDSVSDIFIKDNSEQLEFLKEHLIKFLYIRANGLNDQDIEILTCRYRLDDSYEKKYTLLQISEKSGLSKERVRQLQKIAVNKLRQSFIQEGLI